MQNPLDTAVCRLMDFLLARQARGGWDEAWYLPSLQTGLQLRGFDRPRIQLSHNVSPAIAQTILRAATMYDRPDWLDAAGRFVEVLKLAACPGGGWPLSIGFDPDGRPVPSASYWQHDAGPARGVFKNGCTGNSILLMLLYAQLAEDRQARKAADEAVAFLLQAQDENPLGLWCNAFPTLPTDDPFGNCAAGLADDSGTPMNMWVLWGMYRSTGNPEFLERLVRSARTVTGLFRKSGKAWGWARYYDATGKPCDARALERATNVETETAVHLVSILLQVYRETGDAVYLTPCEDWASNAMELLESQPTPGWARLYDAVTGRAVFHHGGEDHAVWLTASSEVGLALLQLFDVTQAPQYLESARALGEFLCRKLPQAGWWALGYDRESGEPLSLDWRDMSWGPVHNTVTTCAPLVFLRNLATQSREQRYAQVVEQAVDHLLRLQLDCGAWTFTSRYETWEPGGKLWRRGDVACSEDADRTVPSMHRSQCVFAGGESGYGVQIVAWELMNLAGLRSERGSDYPWLNCYGMPAEYLLDPSSPS